MFLLERFDRALPGERAFAGGLSLALAGIFIATMLVHTWSGWMMFAAEDVQHGSTPVLWGDDGYIWLSTELKVMGRVSGVKINGVALARVRKILGRLPKAPSAIAR